MITLPQVLRRIFAEDMVTPSDRGNNIFYPVGFLQNVKTNTKFLNKVLLNTARVRHGHFLVAFCVELIFCVLIISSYCLH